MYQKKKLGIEDTVILEKLHKKVKNDINNKNTPNNIIRQLIKMEAELARYKNLLKGDAVPVIGVFGCPSSGKSTFINVLLGDEILPMDGENGTTRFPIEILQKATDSNFIITRKRKDNSLDIKNDIRRCNNSIDVITAIDELSIDADKKDSNTEKIIIESQFNCYIDENLIIYDTPGIDIEANEENDNNMYNSHSFTAEKERALAMLDLVDVVIFCTRWDSGRDSKLFNEKIKQFSPIVVIPNSDNDNKTLEKIIEGYNNNSFYFYSDKTIYLSSKIALENIKKEKNNNSGNCIEKILEKDNKTKGFIVLKDLIFLKLGLRNKKNYEKRIKIFIDNYNKLWNNQKKIIKKPNKTLTAIMVLTLLAVVLFFVLLFKIEYRLHTVEFFEDTSFPSEFTGRWHSGSGKNEPFLFEVTSNGQLIRADGLPGKKLLREGRTLIIYSGTVTMRGSDIIVTKNGKTTGSANYIISDNLLMLTNIQGKMSEIPIDKFFKHDISFDYDVDDKKYTKAVNFSFEYPVQEITSDNIFIIDDTGSIEAGTFSGKEKTWTLPITVVKAGDIIIKFNMPGIDNTQKRVTVDNTISWTAAPVNNPYTTHINFTFSHPVKEFDKDSIEITDDTTSIFIKEEDVLSEANNGNLWMLPITFKSFNSGTVNVLINMPGIEKKEIPILINRTPVTWKAKTVGDPTTGIEFEFSEPFELLSDNIEITSETCKVETGTLSGGENLWLLPIMVNSVGNGNIYVFVDIPGNESDRVRLDVTRETVSWNASAVYSLTSSIIIINFAEPVELTEKEIRIINGKGIAEKGSLLNGNGTTWSFNIIVRKPGEIKVSVIKDGIDNNTETIMVYLPPVRTVSVGTGHNVLIREDGSLWVWGSNNSGQLGNGGTGNSNILTKMDNNIWKSVSAGGRHTAAIREDGSLWTWGNNDNGQLGNRTKNHSRIPIQILETYNWNHVTAGISHTMAIREDGTLWAWGNNDHGKLGNNTARESLIPIHIEPNYKWISVSAGAAHTAAIREDGSLWTWGNNEYGKLGDNTTRHRRKPIRVAQNVVWSSVSAGAAHTAAIMKDGSLWTWGNNTHGQLGDGTTVNKHVPIPIKPDYKWVSVSAGTAHTVAIKDDGSLWVWGSNEHGRLGDGTTVGRHIPTPIEHGYIWDSVSAGISHTLAVRADGSLWCWGNNDNGQLGDGTITRRSRPYQIEVPPTASVTE